MDKTREMKEELKKTNAGRVFLEEAEPENHTNKMIEFAKDHDKMIEFAIEHCDIFPEDSYMGKYLRETIKMLQAEPCEDVPDTNVGNNKAEELRMEKHTDRQIYDGCIHLMQNMVDHFQEYLDYLGYDLDKLDEDERFAVGISNMEIVRYLFLYHTRNSGGCSTIDFCEKLGVDPYDSVKFEFERDEEE